MGSSAMKLLRKFSSGKSDTSASCGNHLFHGGSTSSRASPTIRSRKGEGAVSNQLDPGWGKIASTKNAADTDTLLAAIAAGIKPPAPLCATKMAGPIGPDLCMADATSAASC